MLGRVQSSDAAAAATADLSDVRPWAMLHAKRQKVSTLQMDLHWVAAAHSSWAELLGRCRHSLLSVAPP